MKKLVSLLLAMVCLVSLLTGCSGSTPTPNEGTGGNFCTECGASLSATDKFCSGCGNAIDGANNIQTTTNNSVSITTSNEINTPAPTTKAPTTKAPTTKAPTKAPTTTAHKHYFSDASCSSPATCSCGATQGSAWGHKYRNGICKTCNAKDPDYGKTYYAGQTWIVDGEWEFTIDSVTEHYFCSNLNTYDNVEANCEQCIMITYSYKNIGFSNSNYTSLMFLEGSFTVYDKNDEVGESYAILGCDHSNFPSTISPGKKCNGASVTFALYTKSKEVTIEVKHTKSDRSDAMAQFIVPVT